MSDDEIFNPLEVAGYGSKQRRRDVFAKLCIQQIEEAIKEMNREHPGSNARLLSFEITAFEVGLA